MHGGNEGAASAFETEKEWIYRETWHKTKVLYGKFTWRTGIYKLFIRNT